MVGALPSWLRSAPRLVLGVALAVVAVVLLVSSKYGILFGKTGSWPHQLQMTVPSAFQATPGQRVVAAGGTVGEITEAQVTDSGQAHLVIGLDDKAWPLPRDSKLALRMGGTIKFTDRYLEITKGRAASSFSEDATVPARQFEAPVEYNDLFNIFDKRTRAGMKDLFVQAGPALSQAARPLRKALPVAPAPLEQGTAVVRDLNDEQQALTTLVATGGQLSRAVATSNPGVQTLITGAANTLTATAAANAQLAHLMKIGTQTNRDLTKLLDHAGETLDPAAKLARHLQPGLTQLDQLATPLNDTMRQLVAVEQPAVRALQTVKTKGPAITGLLTRGREDLLPRLTSIADQAKPIVGCLRPYTPDIMNFFLNFPALNGGIKNPDIHLLHVAADLWPFTNQEQIDSEELGKRFPEIKVQFPMPPGAGWNQPWYQPQCGVSEEQTSNAGDSESGTYDPNGSKSTSYSSTVPTYDHPPTKRTVPVRTAP